MQHHWDAHIKVSCRLLAPFTSPHLLANIGTTNLRFALRKVAWSRPHSQAFLPFDVVVWPMLCRALLSRLNGRNVTME